MIKRIILLFSATALVIGLNAQGLKGAFNKLKKETGLNSLSSLTDEEAGSGLKEALNIGVSEAVDFLSEEDGYYKSIYKILLPEEAQAITNKLKAVPGFSNFEEELLEKVNRAAEDAAEKAKPIFVDAIKGMSFTDAMNILMGNKDAATRYLEKSTYDNLYEEFKPVIIESLDKFNAREYWREATTAYNKIPFVKKTNTELDDYVTTQSLGGLFGLVEVKEEDIHSNVSSRSSDLLKKVFAKQD